MRSTFDDTTRSKGKRVMRPLIVILALAALPFSSTSAARTQEALERLQERASAGELSAQKKLGELYLQGGPVQRDPAESLRWYKTAAGAGDIDAQLLVGKTLLHGLLTPVDMPAAHLYLTFADQSGSNEAKVELLAHKRLTGGSVDAAGLQFLRDSADKKCAAAQRELGLRVAAGEVPNATSQEALRWLSIAADRRDIVAMRYLAEVLMEGNEEIGKQPLRAINYLRNLAACGDHDALLTLSRASPKNFIEICRKSTANPRLIDLLDELSFCKGDFSNSRILPGKWTQLPFQVVITTEQCA